MNLDEQLQQAIQNIAANHRTIIDDWCKAYMAQLYQEGVDVKPGCFTLIEQDLGMYNGKYCKRYWFERRKKEETEMLPMRLPESAK